MQIHNNRFTSIFQFPIDTFIIFVIRRSIYLAVYIACLLMGFPVGWEKHRLWKLA